MPVPRKNEQVKIEDKFIFSELTRTNALWNHGNSPSLNQT